MYDMQWGKKTPGLLIFMIDQSGSMECEDKHKKVVTSVQNALWECLLGCVNGMEVRNRMLIKVIGYGDNVKEIMSSWIGEEDFINKLRKSKDGNGFLIPPVADGVTPMASAFDLVYSTIKKWFDNCEEQIKMEKITGIPAPIVVNITDGEPCEYQNGKEDAVSNAKKAAQKVMNLSTSDGNVRIFNLHLSDNANSSIEFPKEYGDLDGKENSKFLFDISTVLDDKMASVAKRSGLETARVGSHGLIVNANGSQIASFIEFGSAVSGVK